MSRGVEVQPRRLYHLSDDMTIHGRWVVGMLKNAGQCLHLIFGQRVEGRALEAEVTPGEPLEFSLTSMCEPIVTEPLANIISTVAGSDVEVLPVRLSDGQQHYYAINVLADADCLDESSSDFAKWTEQDARPDLAGEYRYVRHLRLDSRRVPPELNIFRVRRWPLAIIVSSLLKASMESIDHRGAVFEDVTSYPASRRS